MATPQSIHDEIAQLWNDRDFVAFGKLMHDDYTYMGPDGKELQGREAGIAIATMYANAFPDARMKVVKTYVVGDASVSELVVNGTHKGELNGIPPTNKAVHAVICDVMELRDGMIYREREYYDVMSLLVQLGVMPGASAHAAG